MTETKRREKVLRQFVTKILGTNNWSRTIYIYTSNSEDRKEEIK